MVSLEVYDYFDVYNKKLSRLMILEKGGVKYNAGHLFFRLSSDIQDNLENSKELFKEELQYDDSSIENRDMLINEILKLEKEYGVDIFIDNPDSLKYWAYLQDITKVAI